MSRAVIGLPLFAAVAVLSAAALPAQAAESTDTAAIRAEIAAMKADYEARIAALEARVAAAEAARGPSPDQTAAGSAEAAPQADSVEMAENSDLEAESEPVTPVANPNAMNPGIAVVLNGNYFSSTRDPSIARMPGFEIADETGSPPRGFSLAESEVTLMANVDPYMSAALTVAFDGEGAAQVEEAFIQSTSMPGGLTLKGGRFFSGVGYLNERHAHNWMFIDMPLPYRAFMGGQYGDDGVQVRWLAPTEFFLEFGAEAFRGDAFPAGGAANRGVGTWTAFVHTGADINDSSSWMAGASWVKADADGRETEDPLLGLNLFSGKTDLGILTGVYKWAPGGNATQRSFTVTGEYFFGNESGDFNGVPVNIDRTGWYLQAAYKYRQRWTAGLRYSRIDTDNPGALLVGSTLDSLGVDAWSASALLEYDSSEFGRFRLQYTRDESDLRPSDQFWFQYTVIYGPHVAHRY